MSVSSNRVIAVDVEELVTLAIKNYDEGRLGEAEELCYQIDKSSPNHPKVLNLLGILHFQSGRQNSGFSYLQRAVALQPDFVGAQFNLAKAFRLMGQIEDAFAAYQKTLALNPDHIFALNDLGNVLYELGRLSEAIDCFNQIFEINPDFAEARNNLAQVLVVQGELDKAEANYRLALKLRQGSTVVNSNLLLCLQYNPAISDDQLFFEHQAWDFKHGHPKRAHILPCLNVPSPDRVICIGYLSPDLGKHPVGYFLSSVLSSHDRQRVKVICYSDRVKEDEMTDQLRQNVDVWRPVNNFSDEQLAGIIRADKVDILVDLAGHTCNNRLTLFAMKPVPVQVSWAGYVGTTGLSAMDYLLSDDRQSPDGAEAYCVESIIRLPDCYVCYSPPEYAPAVRSLPALRNGYVTFGCFNNLAKITPQVIELWVRLLKRIPDSRLVIRTMSLSDLGVQARYLEFFNDNGVLPPRILLGQGLPHGDLLDEYNSIDIALDPFPYSGGITTLESLWMGVPVITLGGSRFCSRHSVSHLTTIGLCDLIASSQDDYLLIAERLVQDKSWLSSLRSGLRKQMAGSPICDAPRFTRNLEDAFRGMWVRWCDKQKDVQL